MLFDAKKKSAINLWREGRKLKYTLPSERSYLKRLHCMIPTTWHSRKGKTMKMLKRSVVAEMGLEVEWRSQTQSPCSETSLCDTVRMDESWYIRPNLWMYSTTTGCALMYPVDLGQPWRVTAGPSPVTNVPVWWSMFLLGRLWICGNREVNEKPLCLFLNCGSKIALKK